jgi:hypothetical protein
MRLWSIHPKYLDRIGLVALWREGLLAQKVLLGRTRGYTAHPQLDRFRARPDPVRAIGCYLGEVLKEAGRRGYHFDSSKIAKQRKCQKMKVRKGQLEFEWCRLLGKLRTRAPEQYKVNKTLIRPKPHPLFQIAPGGREKWERVDTLR